jgi:hypothetical protein
MILPKVAESLTDNGFHVYVDAKEAVITQNRVSPNHGAGYLWG